MAVDCQLFMFSALAPFRMTILILVLIPEIIRWSGNILFPVNFANYAFALFLMTA